jgi:hypothetical protein
LDPTLEEDKAYLTVPAYIFVAYLWLKRKTLDSDLRQQVSLWSVIGGFFFLSALGPALHVAGSVVWDKFMPYTLLTGLLPFMGLSGVPVRMTGMVMLAASMLSAIALREMFIRFPGRRILTIVLLGALLFEIWPASIVTTPGRVPDYIDLLAELPDDGGLLNQIWTSVSMQMYYQTVHEKPITYGYISRISASVAQKDEQLSAAIDANDFAQLWSTYHIRYVLSNVSLSASASQPYMTFELLYDKKGVKLYRIGCICAP